MNKHESTKPHVMVGTLGHQDHARSVVIAAPVDSAVANGINVRRYKGGRWEQLHGESWERATGQCRDMDKE